MKLAGALVRSAGVVVAATALTIGTASISSAAAATTGNASCSTTGASGAMSIKYTGGEYFDELPVSLSVTDTVADGHHVRVRLITTRSDLRTVNWPWHSLTTGKGQSLSISTSARDTNGIYDAGVQVARFEGNTLLNSCTKWM